MSVKIVQVREHCEVYIDGEFYCSTDDWSEAKKEIEKYEEENCCILM